MEGGGGRREQGNGRGRDKMRKWGMGGGVVVGGGEGEKINGK